MACKQAGINRAQVRAGHQMQIVHAQGFPPDWNHLTKSVPPGISVFYIMRRSLPAKTETKYSW